MGRAGLGNRVWGEEEEEGKVIISPLGRWERGVIEERGVDTHTHTPEPYKINSNPHLT